MITKTFDMNDRDFISPYVVKEQLVIFTALRHFLLQLVFQNHFLTAICCLVAYDNY